MKNSGLTVDPYDLFSLPGQVVLMAEFFKVLLFPYVPAIAIIILHRVFGLFPLQGYLMAFVLCFVVGSILGIVFWLQMCKAPNSPLLALGGLYLAGYIAIFVLLIMFVVRPIVNWRIHDRGLLRPDPELSVYMTQYLAMFPRARAALEKQGVVRIATGCFDCTTVWRVQKIKNALIPAAVMMDILGPDAKVASDGEEYGSPVSGPALYFVYRGVHGYYYKAKMYDGGLFSIDHDLGDPPPGFTLDLINGKAQVSTYGPQGPQLWESVLGSVYDAVAAFVPPSQLQSVWGEASEHDSDCTLYYFTKAHPDSSYGPAPQRWSSLCRSFASHGF